MSDGGGQFFRQQFVDAGGEPYSGVKVYHYAAGTSNLLNVWTDEAKTTPAAQPVVGDSKGMVSFFADGDYQMVIKDSDDVTLYTWDNIKITSDTATMWEGNFGTSYPSAATKNRWQLFAKVSASNKLIELGINEGAAFRSLGAGIPVVDVRGFDSFSDAIDDIGTSEKVLLIPDAQTVSANKTVLATTHLWFLKGGSLAIDGGVTVTINGTLEAAPYQIFSGTGLVDLSGASVPHAYAEWWGIDGAADEVEINKAITAANRVLLLGKTYTVADTVKYKNGTVLKGVSKQNTLIQGNLTKAVLSSIDTATRYYSVLIENFSVDNTDKANAGGIGIDFTKISTGIIRDVIIDNVETGILFDQIGTYYNYVYNPIITTAVTGIKMQNTANENHVYSGKIDTVTTGIYLDSVSNPIINGTEVANFTTGIDIGPSNNVSSFKIYGCRLENVPTVGTGIKIGTSLNSFILGVYCQGLTTYFDFGTNTDTTVVGAYGGLNQGVWKQRGLIFSNVLAWPDGDATPAVNQGGIFKTANTGATTITALDGGITGQVAMIIFGDSVTTIDFTGTTLKGNYGQDWNPETNDSMMCIYDGTNWICNVANATDVLQTYTETNVTPDRAFDADTVAVAELADVVGTLIVDLRARGLLK